MSKKKIVLKFPDLYTLWAFAQRLKANPLEIDSRNRNLTCDCTEDDIALAITDFKAQVVENVYG